MSTLRERDGRLAVLDGLRGLAILLVLMTHSLITAFRPALHLGPLNIGVEPMVFAGSLGVELFFFLSGFVLFVPYAQAWLQGKQMPTLLHFFGRRAIKILPSYIIALFAIAFFFYQPPYEALTLWRDILNHLLFIHTFDHMSMFSIDGPMWSLGTEVQFYVFFPAIAWLMCRRPVWTYALALAIGEGYRLWIHSTGAHQDFWWVSQLPGQIDLFVLGMACAFAFVWIGKTKVAGSPTLALAATLIALVSFGFGTWLLNDFSHITQVLTTGDHQSWQNDHRLVVSWTIAAIALSSLFAARWWQRILANPIMLFLSTLSYNLYLWHGAILVQCSKTGIPCSLDAMPWYTSRNWSVQYFVMYIGVSVAIAAAMTYLLEQPLLRLRLRRNLAVRFGYETQG